MKHLSSLERGCPARLVALALLIALSPLPAFAGPPAPPAGTPGIRQSIATISATQRLAAAPNGAAQAGATPDKGSPSFFRKPIGIAILATFATGVGYALYSTQHDRVHSAGKK